MPRDLLVNGSPLEPVADFNTGCASLPMNDQRSDWELGERTVRQLTHLYSEWNVRNLLYVQVLQLWRTADRPDHM